MHMWQRESAPCIQIKEPKITIVNNSLCVCNKTIRRHRSIHSKIIITTIIQMQTIVFLENDKQKKKKKLIKIQSNGCTLQITTSHGHYSLINNEYYFSVLLNVRYT